MEFQEVVSDLVSGERATGLNPRQRKLWPRFAYHFTDIVNAVSILKMKKLVARNIAKKNGLMKNDNASSEVIDGTSQEIADFVRLYFRPKTPTQYYNEGFQVRERRARLGADCPIPVFFLFDLPSLLSREEVAFTDRTLAMHQMVERYQTPTEFAQLPFDRIFHNRAIMPEERRSIIPARQAEIIIPRELDLAELRVLLVRSVAEKETLINLLHDQDVQGFEQLVHVSGEDFFFMDRSFISDVDATSNSLTIKSSANGSFPSDWGTSREDAGYKFAVNKDAVDKYLSVVVKVELSDGQVLIWPREERRALLIDEIRLKFKEPLDKYRVLITIDGHVAYEGDYQNETDIDLPF